MKRTAFLAYSLLAATPALAQQPPPAPGQEAWRLMFEREVASHHDDLGAAIQEKAQLDEAQRLIATLQQYHAALSDQRDRLARDYDALQARVVELTKALRDAQDTITAVQDGMS